MDLCNYYDELNTSHRIIYITLYKVFGGIIIFIAIIGNFLIIVYFGFKEKKTSYTVYILLLGVTDFVGTISCFLLFLQSECIFGFDPVFCLLMRLTMEIFLSISAFLVLGMLYERYRGITMSINSRKTKRIHVLVYCVVVCILWELYEIPLYRALYNDNGWSCLITITNELFIFTFYFFIYLVQN